MCRPTKRVIDAVSLSSLDAIEYGYANTFVGEHHQPLTGADAIEHIDRQSVPYIDRHTAAHRLADAECYSFAKCDAGFIPLCVAYSDSHAESIAYTECVIDAGRFAFTDSIDCTDGLSDALSDGEPDSLSGAVVESEPITFADWNVVFSSNALTDHKRIAHTGPLKFTKSQSILASDAIFRV